MDNLTERSPLDQGALGDLMCQAMWAGDVDDWKPDGTGFTVYAIYDTADVVTASNLNAAMGPMGQPIVVGRYGAQPAVGPHIFDPAYGVVDGRQTAGETFYNFAINMGYADPEKADQVTIRPGTLAVARAMLQQPGILGFMARLEAYSFKEYNPLVDALVQSGMDVSTIAGATPCRLIYVCDMQNQLHTARQWQDNLEFTVEHDVHPCNEVSIGLRVLVDVASGEPMPTHDRFQAHYHAGCDN